MNELVTSLQCRRWHALTSSLHWIFPRTKAGVPYIDFKHLISQYIFSTWQERCGRKQASFCQASPGRLAVLLQAVQEG